MAECFVTKKGGGGDVLSVLENATGYGMFPVRVTSADLNNATYNYTFERRSNEQKGIFVASGPYGIWGWAGVVEVIDWTARTVTLIKSAKENDKVAEPTLYLFAFSGNRLYLIAPGNATGGGGGTYLYPQ